MARIRHIALWSQDPPKTAEYYKKVFGLTELFRRPADTGEDGVYMSDGYIFFVISKSKSDSSKSGFNHLGFAVDNLEQTCTALQAASFTNISGGRLFPGGRLERFEGPDGVVIEMREHGWDNRISEDMKRYQPTSASSAVGQGKR